MRASKIVLFLAFSLVLSTPAHCSGAAESEERFFEEYN